VRCLAASALGIPSIVSPTLPLLEAVANGGAGLVARDSTDWESALEQLIGDPDLRIETGRKAQGRALGMCDFSKWSAGVSRILSKTIGEAGRENARA